MSNLSEPLSFRPRVSSAWLLVLAAAAVGGLLVLAERSPPVALFLLWGGGLVAALIAAWRSQRRLHWLRRCHLHPDGRIFLQSRDGRRCGARVVSRFAHPWLVALTVRTVDGRRYDLFIPRGRLGTEHHRRLRVWARSRPIDPPAGVIARGKSASGRKAGVLVGAGRWWSSVHRRAPESPGCSVDRGSPGAGRRSAP